MEEEQDNSKKNPNHVYQQILKDFQVASHADEKLNLPKFNGDGFMDWLLQGEAVFTYKQFRDPKRVHLAQTKLRKGATHWWRNIQLSREKVGIPHIIRWADMKLELEQWYVPASYREDIFKHIASLLKVPSLW